MPPKVIKLLIAALMTLMLGLQAGLAQNTSAETPSAQSQEMTVIVFAAASLKTALDQIGTEWTAATGKRVSISYAASSALAKQIEQGAPADLFASADLNWMDYLAERKLIVPETRVDLLSNTLVLIAPVDSAASIKIEKGFALADAIGDGKLATGDPKSVPAGAYAEASLRALGVWEAVSPKIAGAENVRAALAFVARKEAPFGIVYGSDAKSESKVRVIGEFPKYTHPPIVYPFAITSASKNQSAKEFIVFLSSARAKRIFEAQGFLPAVR